MILWFNQRKEWADRFEQWAKENDLANSPLNVISFLVVNGWKHVVTCKECIYRHRNGMCLELYLRRGPDDYCSYGVRKENK